MGRKGLTLVEAMVAVLILAAPLASILGLERGNTRGARFDADRLAEDQLTTDLLEMLIALPPSARRGLAADGAQLDHLLETRLALCALSGRPAVEQAVHALTGHLACHVDEGVGGHPELTRITLGKRVRLVRDKRGAAAEMLAAR